ncbi:DUF6634 family protein [Shinella zoogloeoides]|uniref:DUF6634 family protein n=1 Tax=Shinella zoogloeoides TaxID=352475 RepID=UPI000E65E682|nr:DUF6634 family protein [Shinella zoogloeoides]
MKFAYLSAEDAQRLSADLRSVEAGITHILSLHTAPILEAHQMYSRRTACLSGYVFGHPSLGDSREIMTSQLMYMDTEVGIARTINRWYRLAAEPEPKDSSSAGLAEATWEKKEPSELETRPTDGVVVISGIGNDTTADGKRVEKEFAKFKLRPLPLPGMPDLTTVRAQLIAEFPYAVAVVDNVLEGLVGRPNVHLKPTVLLGAPGSGKTRFARRLTEELRAPCELISCGGLSDSAIGGTARRWSSGEPSLPVMAVREHECAGPVVILDEIEKIGAGRNNGNVHDVLIGLFEPETSRRWHDPYLEAHCDLSRVSWLMTANSLEPVPAALRDRCRILPFPNPGADQLPLFATRILQRLYIETGHDPRWATPLEGFELDALASFWTGGSIRKLERLVEVLREARERARRRQ